MSAIGQSDAPKGGADDNYLGEFFVADLTIAVCVKLADHRTNLFLGQVLSYRLNIVPVSTVSQETRVSTHQGGS
jgi:hypothetical protein